MNSEKSKSYPAKRHHPIGIAIESRERKVELDQMAAMLSRFGKHRYSVEGNPAAYGIDFDSDFDETH